MARRKRKKQEESGGGNWLTTFSDLMSLLLTFFILLFSMSSVGEDEINAASSSFQQGFMGGGASVLDGHGITEMDTADGNGIDKSNGPGDDKGEDNPETSEPDLSTDIVENFDPEAGSEGEYYEEEYDEYEYDPDYAGEAETVGQTEVAVVTEPVSDIPEAVQEIHTRAQNIIDNQGYGNQMSAYSDSRGVYLYIHESILFESGKSSITSTGRQTLNSLTELLNRSDNDILIEGFTDDLPIANSQYPSNWELSAGRAMAVVRYFAENQGVSPSRLSGRGYGEHHPIVPNDSDSNRSMNRRVNIVLVYQGEGN